MQQEPILIIAGVIVVLSLMVLLGFTVWVLRTTTGLATVLKALAIPLGAVPAVLYALFWLYG
ncbi:hypothetical protein [Actinomadura kijaniata]|uniref:hypothetical protein n=1 Tax=Actinomadura kijaniata TaxID=46161 RepID=UPI000AA5C2D3|nr:hypothetical protein [Actinomadura kijaniata]